MINQFKEGKKAGMYFAKSVQHTNKKMTRKDILAVVGQYEGDYKKGFVEGWKAFHNKQ